jgi:diadenosine tetraphosphate (Ap4A) HIT family hydrolase
LLINTKHLKHLVVRQSHKHIHPRRPQRNHVVFHAFSSLKVPKDASELYLARANNASCAA